MKLYYKIKNEIIKKIVLLLQKKEKSHFIILIL